MEKFFKKLRKWCRRIFTFWVPITELNKNSDLQIIDQLLLSESEENKLMAVALINSQKLNPLFFVNKNTIEFLNYCAIYGFIEIRIGFDINFKYEYQNNDIIYYKKDKNHYHYSYSKSETALKEELEIALEKSINYKFNVSKYETRIPVLFQLLSQGYYIYKDGEWYKYIK